MDITPVGPAGSGFTPLSRKADDISQPSEPRDSSDISGVKHLSRKNLQDLILGKGSATNIREFFKRDMHPHLERSYGREFPQGGWKVTPGDGGETYAYHLDDSLYEGILVSHDSPDKRPFGRWKRMSDGWVGESTFISGDPGSIIARSMMSTFLGDDRRIEMVLTEITRDGGGLIYELDADSYFKNPAAPPPVKNRFEFSAGEARPIPPFPCHTSIPASGPLSARQYFRDWVAEYEAKWATPSLYTLQPAWEVKLNRPLDASDIIVVLGRGEKPGTKKEGVDPFNKSCRIEWERVKGGWKNVKEGTLNPEGFIQLKSSSLETVLKDDGTASLTLTESYDSGEGCVFELDGNAFLKNPRKPPPVLSAKPFGMRDEHAAMTPDTARASDEADKSAVVTDDGWLIIDGVRIKIKQE